MQRWLRRVLVALLAAVPTATLAAPCLVDTLDDYITLGSCEVDSTVFSGFDLVLPLPFGATPIDASAITVTPLDATNPGLQFTFTSAVGAGGLASALFEFEVTRSGGLSLFGASQTLDGASATGDGVSIFVSDLCLGGTFALPPSLCGGSDTAAMTTFVSATDSFVAEAIPFAATPSVHVVANFIVDGGLSGSASATGGSLRFATTPTQAEEPGTLALVLGVVAWLAYRRTARSS